MPESVPQFQLWGGWFPSGTVVAVCAYRHAATSFRQTALRRVVRLGGGLEAVIFSAA